MKRYKIKTFRVIRAKRKRPSIKKCGCS